jgi:hypothetical protein
VSIESVNIYTSFFPNVHIAGAVLVKCKFIYSYSLRGMYVI